MNLYYVVEGRFIRRNGVVYSLGGFEKSLWARYLKYFDCIKVIARVSDDCDMELTSNMEASMDGVEFIDVPYYVGFKGYLQKRNSIKKVLKKNLKNDGVYLCRIPGSIGTEVIKILRKNNIPYFCEVVGDPWDVFARGSVNHPLRPIIRLRFTYKLKKEVFNSNGALYVTQRKLQQRYPVRDNIYQVGVSDVIIPNDIFPPFSKKIESKDSYKLISIGSLDQLYKAPDVVIQSVKILKDLGVNCFVTWLGDGIYKGEMQKLAKEYGVDMLFDFKGNVSKDLVNNYLDESDIFLLVSRTEGLPRALIEAMSHGLPCIGSKVGGIPELLDNDALVSKNNPKQLANLILKMVSDVNFTNEQAYRNLQEARKYQKDILDEKRNDFFVHMIKSYSEK